MSEPRSARMLRVDQAGETGAARIYAGQLAVMGGRHKMAGEIRHMAEQARVGKAAGIPHQVVQKNGDLVRLAPGKPGKLAEVRAGRLVLDGDIITPADGQAMVMRRRLAHNGIVIVVVLFAARTAPSDAAGDPVGRALR